MGVLTGLLWMVMVWQQAGGFDSHPCWGDLTPEGQCLVYESGPFQTYRIQHIYTPPQEKTAAKMPCRNEDERAKSPGFVTCDCPRGYSNTQNFIINGGEMEATDTEHCERDDGRQPDAVLSAKATAPFDVPAVETDGPDTVGSRYKSMWGEPCNDDVNKKAQVPPCSQKIHRRKCADKSRFLLMSEDGRWHCLALGQKP